jgi:hypothetical protein
MHQRHDMQPIYKLGIPSSLQKKKKNNKQIVHQQLINGASKVVNY